MRVELDHTALVAARSRMLDLANEVEQQTARAGAGSPIELESLEPLPDMIAWLRDQAIMLAELAAIALLLDREGAGPVVFTVAVGSWDPTRLLAQTGDELFGPGFSAATHLGREELARLLTTFGSVGRDLPDGTAMTADQLRQFIIDRPRLALALTTTRPADPELTAATHPLGDAMLGPLLPDGLPSLRDILARLTPDHAAILAMTYPTRFAHHHDVPFTYRGHANTIRIVAARQQTLDQIADVKRQWPDVLASGDLSQIADYQQQIDDLQQRVDVYDTLTRPGRVIVHFDPAGDVAIAELHGSIDQRTRNIAILVPGTSTDLTNYETLARRSRLFLRGEPPGSLAMISWLGGDLPDHLHHALSADYSNDLAPRLVDVTSQVRNEAAHTANSDQPARITVAGHSYGGAAVGQAERHGLDADRVLHIASAGMGQHINHPDDLPPAQGHITRYSLTAPGDPIEHIQGRVHGADPDTFPGTTGLHTGNKTDGTPNTGWNAHSDVFEPGSDAWKAMRAVFKGTGIEDHHLPPPPEPARPPPSYPRPGQLEP